MSGGGPCPRCGYVLIYDTEPHACVPLVPVQRESESAVDHPAHYGGGDNPYEVIKVIEAWGLGFNLGNVLKYIGRAGRKSDLVEDLKKALWYLNREIKNEEKRRQR